MRARNTKSATAPQRAARASTSLATGSSKKLAAAKRPAKKPPPAAQSVEETTVAAAVRRDLEALAKIGDIGAAVANGALAMAAIALAKSIDHDHTSPTARSMCARALTETLEKLRGLVPDESQEGDRIDDLAERRQHRRARGTAA